MPFRNDDPLLSRRVLAAALAISMLTNLILVVRMAQIDWHRFVHRDQAVPAVGEMDHVLGNPAAPVTLIEYSDFECPFCARFRELMATVIARHPGDVRWVYRHLPLPSIHPVAIRAAEASECAADQGRFWEYGALLFQRQQELGDAALAAAARDLGLDMPLFQACLDGGTKRERVLADARAFTEGHLAGTPTVFVNGTRVDTLLSVADLERAIANARGNQ